MAALTEASIHGGYAQARDDKAVEYCQVAVVPDGAGPYCDGDADV